MGKKDATLSLPAFSFDVEKITVVGVSGASQKVTQNVYVGEVAVSTQTTGATGSHDYAINADYQAAGNIYTIKVTNSYNTQISKILIYKKEGGSEVTKVDAPTFSVSEGTFSSAFTLKLSTATSGAKIYYTTDGTNPTAESTLYTDEGIAISQTTTVKAVAEKDGTLSDVAAAVYTYKEGVVPTGTYTYEKVTSTDGLVDGGIYIIVNETNNVAMGWLETDKRHTAAITVTDGKISLDAANVATEEGQSDKVYEIALEAASDSWLLKDIVADQYLRGGKASLENVSSPTTSDRAAIAFTTQGNVEIKYSTYELLYNKSASIFRCYASGQQKVQLYRRVGTFKITAAGYATHYTENAYAMPEGVKGATVTEDGDALSLNYIYPSGTAVPAKSPLVLKGAEGTYTYAVLSSDATPATDNLLHGSTTDVLTDVEGATYYYKLSYDDNGENLGFYWAAENGAAFTSKGGLCFLALFESAKQNRKSGIAFDDMATTTSIDHTSTMEKTQSAPVYTLDGRRVQRIAGKGFYIVGGKKYIVK